MPAPLPQPAPLSCGGGGEGAADGLDDAEPLHPDGLGGPCASWWSGGPPGDLNWSELGGGELALGGDGDPVPVPEGGVPAGGRELQGGGDGEEVEGGTVRVGETGEGLDQGGGGGRARAQSEGLGSGGGWSGADVGGT